MRVAHDSNIELLQKGFQCFQLGMGPPQRGIEARLISFLERGKVNRLDGRVELLLALRLSVFIRIDDRSGRQQFRSQKGGVGPSVRGFNRQFTVKEFALCVVVRDHSRRDQEFLSWLCVLRQQHWQDVVVAPAIKNRAVGEDCDLQARFASKSQINRHARALSGVEVNLLGNLHPASEHAGSRPVLLILVHASGARDVLHRQGTPVRVVQTRIFRMRNIRVITPLTFALTSQCLQSIERGFVRVRRIFTLSDCKNREQQNEEY